MELDKILHGYLDTQKLPKPKFEVVTFNLKIWASKIYSLNNNIETLNVHNFCSLKDMDVISTLSFSKCDEL
jgi:hypothetical protein